LRLLPLTTIGRHALGMSSPDGVLPDDDGSDPEIPDYPANSEATWAREAPSGPFPDQIPGQAAPFEPAELGDTLAGPSERSSLPEGYNTPEVAGESIPLDDVELFVRPDGPSAGLSADVGPAYDEVSASSKESRERDDELAGEVQEARPLSEPEMEALLAQLLRPADSRAGEEIPGGLGLESADSGEQPPTGQHETRTPLQAALEQMAMNEEASASAGPPESLDERQPEPTMPEIVSRQPDTGTSAPDSPVGAAEPGSGEQSDADVTAEAEIAYDSQPPELEEVIRGRAGDVLAALESTLSLTEPDPGRQASPSLPTPHTDTSLTAPENVFAAVREILEPTTNSAHERELPPSIDDAELEALITAVVTAVRQAGSGPIGDAVRAATSDPAIFRTLRRIADDPGLSPEAIRNATRRARLSGGAASIADGKLIIALILLLAAGIAVPLLAGAAAGAAAEVILTNEVAIAALAVSVAALRKG
jgi:hypothetical protein